jgi:hypothetical protein
MRVLLRGVVPARSVTAEIFACTAENLARRRSRLTHDRANPLIL